MDQSLSNDSEASGIIPMRWLLDAIVLLIGVVMMPLLAIVLWAL